MVGADWPDIEFVEAIGANFFFIKLIELVSDIINFLLQVEPVLVADQNVTPNLL